MTILDIRINFQFRNAPVVTVVKHLIDETSGEGKTVQLSFSDDDARAIVTMIPNPDPGGTGLVVHPQGAFDHEALDAAISARLEETPKSLADRLGAADRAREELRGAVLAKQAAEQAERDAIERRQQIEVEIAALAETSTDVATVRGARKRATKKTPKKRRR